MESVDMMVFLVSLVNQEPLDILDQKANVD